jgi:hypothetical protein
MRPLRQHPLGCLTEIGMHHLWRCVGRRKRLPHLAGSTSCEAKWGRRFRLPTSFGAASPVRLSTPVRAGHEAVQVILVILARRPPNPVSTTHSMRAAPRPSGQAGGAAGRSRPDSTFKWNPPQMCPFPELIIPGIATVSRRPFWMFRRCRILWSLPSRSHHN